MSRGAGSPGQGGQLTPLKFEIGVQKLISRLCRTGDFLTLTPLLINGSGAPASVTLLVCQLMLFAQCSLHCSLIRTHAGELFCHACCLTTLYQNTLLFVLQQSFQDILGESFGHHFGSGYLLNLLQTITSSMFILSNIISYILPHCCVYGLL